MVLRLYPELVDLGAARGTDPGSGSSFAGRITTSRPFDQASKSGALGHPERATPEKGEALFSVAAKEVVACVREVAGWQVVEPW